MKYVLGAVAAAALLGTPALAQTDAAAPLASANCAGFASAPAMPDGASATQAQMNQGNETYQQWGTATHTKLQACRAEIEAIRAQLNTLEAMYNTSVGLLTTVTAAWEADVAEYNARGASSSGRRERGSVNTRPDN
jgi:hypothetical protein